MNVKRGNLGKLTQLAELAIGDDQLTENTKTLESLVAVLLGGVLVNWHIDSLRVTRADLLRLPDEVLEDVAFVLGEKKLLGLLDHIAQISDELLAVG